MVTSARSRAESKSAIAVEKPTRREQKKEDKRERIRAAAANLFRANGYDGTTTRAIAEQAGIATGTLFLYVRDKDEALAMVYGEEVDQALARPAENRPKKIRFASALSHRLRGLYELYARNPELALHYLRRLPSLADREKVEHAARNAQFVAVIQDEVERAMKARELRADLDVGLAVKTLFAVVRMLIFGWLSAPDVSLDTGLRELDKTLDLLVRGMA